MASWEMALGDLENYTGSNERPEDFDAYWDAALQEMHALGTEYVLFEENLELSFARCYHLYFYGVGHARIHAKLVKPINACSAPAILRFHGYHDNSGAFAPMLPYAAEGFVVAALDCRGQGGLSEDNLIVKGPTLSGHIVRGLADPDCRKLYYRNVFLDCAQLAHILMAMPGVDAGRIGVVGGSQGGGLALACAGLVPEICSAVAMMPFLSDYRRVCALNRDLEAYGELREFYRYFDPNHRHEKEIFTKLGYIDVHHFAPRIQARTLFMTGLLDAVCPPSTQFAAYNGICAKKQMLLFPEYGHEHFPEEEDTCFRFFLHTLADRKGAFIC